MQGKASVITSLSIPKGLKMIIFLHNSSYLHCFIPICSCVFLLSCKRFNKLWVEDHAKSNKRNQVCNVYGHFGDPLHKIGSLKKVEEALLLRCINDSVLVPAESPSCFTLCENQNEKNKIANQ